MTTNHANCSHELTKTGRAACRKQRAELVAFFEGDKATWLFRAAHRFADLNTNDPAEAAAAIIAHPTMQDTDSNRRNGYLPYTTPSELFRRICRVCS